MTTTDDPRPDIHSKWTRYPDNFAKEVVHRHPCDCPSASRPLAEGEEPEHRFDIDGQPFPYCVVEDGIKFTKFQNLWKVTVTLCAIRKDDDGNPVWSEPDDVVFTDTFSCRTMNPPVIAGLPFPWLMSGDGITYTHSHKTLPTVTLSFLAGSVDTDGPYEDRSSDDVTVHDNDGSLWQESQRERRLHDAMREGTKDWPVGRYDPETRQHLERGWSYREDRDEDGQLTAFVAKHPDGTERVFSA